MEPGGITAEGCSADFEITVNEYPVCPINGIAYLLQRYFGRMKF
jgi:hypothetical protein